MENNLSIDFSLIPHSKIILKQRGEEILLPRSKEEMMLSNQFDLLEKRQFMKFFKMEVPTPTPPPTSSFLSFLADNGIKSPLILEIIQFSILKKPLHQCINFPLFLTSY